MRVRAIVRVSERASERLCTEAREQAREQACMHVCICECIWHYLCALSSMALCCGKVTTEACVALLGPAAHRCKLVAKKCLFVFLYGLVDESVYRPL